MLIVKMDKILFIIMLSNMLDKNNKVVYIYHYYYVDLNKKINVYEYASMYHSSFVFIKSGLVSISNLT